MRCNIAVCILCFGISTSVAYENAPITADELTEENVRLCIEKRLQNGESYHSILESMNACITALYQEGTITEDEAYTWYAIIENII